MTERGMGHSDGAPACPFVAFEDDRDERSDRPDHRHRCYAEVHPAPRAIAHQEAYCLSSAFAVCPTFQDWAHREAARTRGGTGVPVPPPVAAVAQSEPEHHHDVDAGRPPEADALSPRAEPAAEWQGPRPAEREDLPGPPPPRRNPPRDWAAPPPWAAGAGAGAAGAGAAGAGASAGGAAAGGGAGSAAPPPQFLAEREARGLAGSSADRVASGESFVPPASQEEPRPTPQKDPWQPSRSPEHSQDADAELAGLVGGGAAAAASRPPDPPSSYYEDTGRYRAEATQAPPGDGREAPSWEQPRRYEAYPTIKTRAALPGLPRLGVMAAALAIAALALFFLPSVLDLFSGGTGGTGSNGESPGPSAPVESVVPSPTVPPAPTPQVYVVKSGDTMSKIADRFNVSIDELIAANVDTIKDPDKISIGDQIIIPVPESEQEPGSFESPAP